jgi:ketosteroid isomerase-like protein
MASDEDPLVDRDATLDAAMWAFGRAWARGDVQTLESLLSPTYTHNDVHGVFQDRAAWLSYASTRAGMNTAITFADLRKRVHGDVAIVTGVNLLDGGATTGAARRTIRFTQVWRWDDGRWLREAFQATTIA